MSSKEMAMQLLASVPDYKLDCVIAYLQGLIAGIEKIPNEEIIEAIREMENGTSHAIRK